MRTLVDVGGVGLLSRLGALLLLARWGGSLLAGLLLLGGSLASWCLAGGGGGLEKDASEMHQMRDAPAIRDARACGRNNSPSELPWVPFRNAVWFDVRFGCGFW